MAKEDLKPIRTTEEAKERGRNGGIRSGEVRRAKKNMREMAKYLMDMEVSKQMEGVRNSLSMVGVGKNDMTYQSAIVVRLIRNAMDGDVSAIRLLGELTGELSKDIVPAYDDPDVIDMEPRTVMIPSNGRDGYDERIISPQPGPQMQFMTSPADIVIYGGAAGGGKTFALLMEMLRHKDVRGFGAVIFRQNYIQISSEGGLLDSSHKIFDMVAGAQLRKSPRFNWSFGGLSRLGFAHIGGDADLASWQGSQIAYIGFDELTHFSKHTFFYMLSRNRSTCGVKPYVRATCNPDPDSWVAEFIEWWIDQETGYAIPERSGVIRWMVRQGDLVEWFGNREDAIAYAKDIGIPDDELEHSTKSVTFIASKVTDNQVLMKHDPGYIANLRALLEVERERLLNGNWKIKPAAGMFFKRSQISIIEELPNDVIKWARGWDLAATSEDENGDPAYTASVLIGKRRNGTYVIANVTNQRLSSSEVRKMVKNTCAMDKKKYKSVMQRLPQDPGQAGKDQKGSYIKMLAGYAVKMLPESGSKETRAEPLATQWQNGNVELLAADWNEMYLTQLESFPESKFKDMVDASSSAFAEIENIQAATPPPEMNKKASYWRK